MPPLVVFPPFSFIIPSTIPPVVPSWLMTYGLWYTLLLFIRYDDITMVYQGLRGAAFQDQYVASLYFMFTTLRYHQPNQPITTIDWLMDYLTDLLIDWMIEWILATWLTPFRLIDDFLSCWSYLILPPSTTSLSLSAPRVTAIWFRSMITNASCYASSWCSLPLSSPSSLLMSPPSSTGNHLTGTFNIWLAPILSFNSRPY